MPFLVRKLEENNGNHGVLGWYQLVLNQREMA